MRQLNESERTVAIHFWGLHPAATDQEIWAAIASRPYVPVSLPPRARQSRSASARATPARASAAAAVRAPELEDHDAFMQRAFPGLRRGYAPVGVGGFLGAKPNSYAVGASSPAAPARAAVQLADEDAAHHALMQSAYPEQAAARNRRGRIHYER